MKGFPHRSPALLVNMSPRFGFFLARVLCHCVVRARKLVAVDQRRTTHRDFVAKAVRGSDQTSCCVEICFAPEFLTPSLQSRYGHARSDDRRRCKYDVFESGKDGWPIHEELTPRISREQRRFAVASRARTVRELDALVSHDFV